MKHSSLRIALKIFLLSLFSALSLTAAAQEKDSLQLRWNVLDSFTWEKLKDVTFTVYEADSTTVICDTVETIEGIYNGEYQFHFYYMNLLRRTAYVLKCKKKGYAPVIVRIPVPKKRYRRPVTEWEADNIMMKKSFEDEEGTDLSEATVTATRIAMVVRGDTIVYDARAFRLAEGSMLDKLISALPGTQLDDNGRITINGKPVRSLLINGRHFFDGDPRVALDNLPAYTVDKLKAYHQEPPGAHLDKNRDKESYPYVLDVQLKREYNKSWIANFEAAGGSKTRKNFDLLYAGRAFAMRATDHSTIGMYGSLNNLGDKRTPGDRGAWKDIGLSDGSRTAKAGGMEINIDGKKGRTFETKIQASHESVGLGSGTNSLSFYSDGNVASKSENYWHKGQTNLSGSSYFNQTFKNAFLLALASFNYSSSRARSNGRNASWNEGRTDTLYTQEYYTRDTNDQWNWLLRGYYRFRSPLTGKEIGLGAEFNYRHTAADAQNGEVLHYPLSHTAQHRKDQLPKTSYHYTFDIRRSLHNVSHQKGKGSYSDLTYSYTQTYYSGRRERTTADEPIDLAPSAQTEQNWMIDDLNSYWNAVLERDHRLNGRFTFFNHQKDVNVAFDFMLDFIKRSIRDVRGSTPLTLTRRHVTFTPSVNIRLNRYTYIQWSYRQLLPEMSYLLDIRNQSNPLSLFLGNPNLKSTHVQEAGFSYRRSFTKRQQNVNFRVSYRLPSGQIGMARTYDRLTGLTVTTPVNVYGSWSGSTDAGYGVTLGKQKRLTLQTNTSYVYRHSVDYYNNGNAGNDPVRSGMENHELSESLALTYALGGMRLKGQGAVSYRRQTSERENFKTGNYIDFNYGITLTTPVFRVIDFETSLTAYVRRKYIDPSMNTTEWVWNAAISHAFGKGKQWVAKLTGTDLLHQLSSVSRWVNSQGITETWYSTVRSYAMFHLIYYLKVKPKKERK